MRQVLRDLLDFQMRGGVNGDDLLLLLSLVNVFGVVDLIGKKQGAGEGQLLERLMGSLAGLTKGAADNGEEDAGAPGLRAIPGGKSLMGLLGGKEGMKALTDLMNNKDFMEKIVPAVMQRFSSSPPPKESGETERETPVARRGRGREVIHWDFGRSEAAPERDGAV